MSRDAEQNDSSCRCSQLALICMASGVTVLPFPQAGRHACKQAAVHAGLSASARRAGAHCRGLCMHARSDDLSRRPPGNTESDIQPLSRQTFRANLLGPGGLDSGENVGVILLAHAGPSSRALLARS